MAFNPYGSFKAPSAAAQGVFRGLVPQKGVRMGQQQFAAPAEDVPVAPMNFAGAFGRWGSTPGPALTGDGTTTTLRGAGLTTPVPNAAANDFGDHWDYVAAQQAEHQQQQIELQDMVGDKGLMYGSSGPTKDAYARRLLDDPVPPPAAAPATPAAPTTSVGALTGEQPAGNGGGMLSA